jgi:aryl sulfotransferase
LGGIFWDGGAQTFIYKGTNARWKDILSKDEVLKYEKMALSELGEECAHWLATGEFLK